MANPVLNSQTRQTGSVYIPRILSDMIIKVREKKLRAAHFVTRRNDAKYAGQTIDFPVATAATSFNYVDGNRLSDNLQASIDTKVSLTISQVPMSPFLILDTLSAQAKADKKAVEYVNSSYVIAKAIDTSILSEGLNFSTNTIQNEGAPTTTALTNTHLTAAQMTLDDLDVPEEDRVWFFRPKVLKDLMDLTGNYFTSLDFSKTQALVEGQIHFMLLGSPVVKTTNMPTATAGSPVATYGKNMYFHKDAIGVAMQKDVETQEEYNMDMQGTLCNVRALYGTATLRANHGVLLYR